jgi:hypothetical protein
VRQGVGHLAGADPLEVQPRHQVGDLLGLAQVRRQDLGRELEPDAVLAHPPVVHPRLPNLQRPHAGQDRPLRLVAVADHQPPARPVAVGRVGLDVLGDLVLNGLLQGQPGTGPGDLLDRGADDRLGGQPENERRRW